MNQIHSSFFDINKTKWDLLKPDQSPFLSIEFYQALEGSGCIGLNSGWLPKIIEVQNGFFIYFIKNHSYGEYIFDWNWAQAYEAHGLNYYPKYLSMCPFTPATKPAFVCPLDDEATQVKLIEIFMNEYDQNKVESAHLLFIQQQDLAKLASSFMIRTSMQYHFINTGFKHFDDFLNTLKPKKKKNIAKERRFTEDINITQYTGNNLTQAHAEQMYSFYRDTISYKGAIAYLNLNFFKEIFKKLKQQVLYVEAKRNDEPIAGSLFFYDENRVYGRYWGATQPLKNLHFELCYYQGIEFAIQNSLKVFEAGAQGEHKIARGFTPTPVYSAHMIKNKNFSDAINQFILKETDYIQETMTNLKQFLPFKETHE